MNNKFRKSVLVISLAATGFAAVAADGDKLIDINFESAVDGQTVSQYKPGVVTDFQQTTLFSQASHPGGDGSMWDPGRYVIGKNPKDYHPFWVDQPNADLQLILNGFQSTNQKVLEVVVVPEVCANPDSKITFDLQAKAANILPLNQASDGGANISVTINGQSIGSADLTSNDPENAVQIIGAVPWAPELTVTLWNNGTAYSGNDFAIDDITLTQRGACEEICHPTVEGVWYNYTGKFDPHNPNVKKRNGLDVDNNGIPDLNDPNWHALPATPGGEHDVSVRGFDSPYQPGKDKGNGDWFVWRDEGDTCDGESLAPAK